MLRSLFAITVLLARLDTAQAENAVLGNGTPASCNAAAFSAAINQVVGDVFGGVLTFNCGPDEHTIEPSAQTFLRGFVVIDGGNKIVLSGRFERRLFEVGLINPEDPTVVEFRNIRLLGGRSVTGFGGAILQRSGTFLSLNGVTLGFNSSELTGGAIASEPSTTLEVRNSNISSNGARSGGAIASTGSVLIEDSIFFRNGVPAEGGGDQQGGAIQSWGQPLIVRRSRFEENGSRFGAAIYKRDGSLEVSDTLFLRNSHDTFVSGDARGGAIMSVGSDTLITRSHFDRNNVGTMSNVSGGALYLENATSCRVRDSSFEGNQAAFGSTVRLARSCTFEQVTMQGVGVSALVGLNASVQAVFTHSTLLANGGAVMTTDALGTAFPRFNSSALSGDVQGFVSPTSGGGNVLHSNLILAGAADINVANQAALGLGAFVSNGGVTRSFLPEPGSPLIDRVPVCVFNADARGAPRPASGSPQCDTGAVERQAIEIAGLIFRNGFD